MKSVWLIGMLVLAQMRLRPSRAVITTIGIMASTCALIWTIQGYDALLTQFDENADKYLGRYDVLIVPDAPPGGFHTIDDALIGELARDPGVLELNPITQSRVTVARATEGSDSESQSPLEMLIGSRPPVTGAPPIEPVLVGTPAAEEPYELVEGSWFDETNETLGAVMSAGAAKQVGVDVGDDVLVTSLANQVRLRVIGVVEQAPETPTLSQEEPQTGGSAHTGKKQGAKLNPPEKPTQIGLPTAYVEGSATNAIYVRPEVAATINGFPSVATVVQIALRDGVTTEQFREVWQARLAAAVTPAKVIDFDDVQRGMQASESIAVESSQAWAATGMAAMAAVFIVFSTLSMGVSERSREFAILRAIALTRGQVAGIVVVESVLFSLLGWIGGLAAGWGMLRIGTSVWPEYFNANATIGSASIVFTGLMVLAGAIGAAVLPAWRAMRIHPLTGSIPTHEFAAAWRLVLALLGIVLAASAPLSVFVVPMSDEARLWTYAFTWPALVIGMMLLTPAITVLCERMLGPAIAATLRLNPKFVENQLSINLWRTIGASLSLSVGLALFTSTQTWGYSMLQPFLPGGNSVCYARSA